MYNSVVMIKKKDIEECIKTQQMIDMLQRHYKAHHGGKVDLSVLNNYGMQELLKRRDNVFLLDGQDGEKDEIKILAASWQGSSSI